MYGLKKRPKDESGLIQGAGTGTSDDIKKNVPAGSYIMPADSTQKIGTDNLKNMGSPTPVNVSNGEYQMSPEQVYQVGMQTLERMKNATHTPVNQPQLGFKPGQSKPELFFANGGEVEWDATDKAKAATLGGGAALYGATKVANTVPSIIGTAANTTPVTMGQMAKATAGAAWDGAKTLKSKPIPGVSNMGGASKLGAFGALATTAIDTATTPTEQYRERFGLGDYNPDDSNGMRFAKDLGVRALGSASDLGNNLTLGLAGKYYQDKQRIGQENQSVTTAQPDPVKAANTPPPVTQPNAATQAAEKAKADTAAKAATQPSMFGDTQQPAQQNAPNPYAIQTKGNSFSYADPQAAAAARAAGIPELQGSGIQGGQGVRGVKEFMANTRQMGPTEQQIQNAIAQREMNIGMQWRAGIPREIERPTLSDEEKGKRDALARQINSAINPKYGPTAKQAEMLLQLSSDNPNALDVYKTDANNAAALQREAMGQVGQNYRAELGEQGANDRFNSNLNFDAQKFNATNDLANRQFSAEQLSKMPERMKQQAEVNLLQQYDAAQTDEERKPILERLSMLRGQTQQQENKFIPLKQGEVVDEKGVITQPAREYLYNTGTNRVIDPLANMQSQQKSISSAEYDALPKGSQYIGEDGKSYIKG